MDAEAAREVRHRAHHRHRPDGIDDVHFFRRENFLCRVRHKTFAAIAAVIRANDNFAVALKFVFKNHPFLGAAADDARHLHAALFQTLRDGMHHGRADAAADAQRVAARNHFRRMAERSGDIADEIAGIQRDQFVRAFADGLDHQRDGSGFGIRVSDGERDALGIFRQMNDDELSRLPDLGDARRVDIQPRDVRAESLFGQNTVHFQYFSPRRFFPPLLYCFIVANF